MSTIPASTSPGSPRPYPAAGLKGGVISVGQATVLGIASSGPAASIALTIAVLASATDYGSGPAIILTAIPMLTIAYAYRRLNLWQQNCGASYEWVGRSLDPYLGFMIGWLMIAGYVIATASNVQVLGPSVLAIFRTSPTMVWANIGIATVMAIMTTAIAVLGIRIATRVQIGFAVIEYVVLVGFSIVGLIAIITHSPGTLDLTSGWLSPSGIHGKGSLAVGFLVSVFLFTGWEGAIYVNEESKDRRRSPGTAVMLTVALLTVLYTFSIVALQGVVSPTRLQKNSVDALIYIAGALGGPGWEKVMALALVVSVIATTATGIVLTARIVYAMARERVLPAVLTQVSERFSTPVVASVLVGLVVLAISWSYLLTTSVQGAFDSIIAVAGILFAVFYLATGVATVVFYRRLVVANIKNVITLGILPMGAVGFLAWVVVESLLTAFDGLLWSFVGIVAVGLVLLVFARLGAGAQFFRLSRQSFRGPAAEAAAPGE